MFTLGSVIDGQENSYTIDGFIGSGNISEVFRCVDKKTNIKYALKYISKTRVGDQKKNSYFENEIDILNSLKSQEIQHENIVKVIEIINYGSVYLVVLEYLHSGNLFDLMQSLKSLNDESLIDIMLQISKGVNHLHNNKIIHRDLKPENIVLQTQGDKKIVKIIDFGVSADQNNQIIKSMVGTISYMAHEVLKGHQRYNEKCDVWSIGCIFHEILSGEQLFWGDKIGKIYNSIINFKGYKYTSKWESIIKQCLEINPEKRISSKELIDLLQIEYNKFHPELAESQTTQRGNDSNDILAKDILENTVEYLQSTPQREDALKNNEEYSSTLCNKFEEIKKQNNNFDTVACFEGATEESKSIDQSMKIEKLNYEDDKKERVSLQTNNVHTKGKKDKQNKEIDEYIYESKKLDQTLENSNMSRLYESEQKFWDFLSKSDNKYILSTALKDITLNYYPSTTDIEQNIKKKIFNSQKEKANLLSDKDFHFAFFHLIIIFQFLKIFQEQKFKQEMTNSVVEKIGKASSNIFKLLIDIFQHLETLKQSSSEKDLQRFMCGLSELDFEKEFQKKVQTYYKFLKFRSFKSIIKVLGKHYLSYNKCVDSVFSTRKIGDNEEIPDVTDVDTLIYFADQTNKSYCIILNDVQKKLISDIKLKYSLFPDLNFSMRY